MIDWGNTIYFSNRSRKFFMDQYAQQARQQGLRSRSWFKLMEIDQCDKLFKAGISVVDLGSSPGGWSSYVVERIGKTGKIIACDLRFMKNISGVQFFKGNCLDPNFLDMLCFWIKNEKVQVVLSDLSPKTTGISIIDVNNSINLGNAALNICRNILTSDGTFLVKVFQGIGFEKYLINIKSIFNTVKVRKPNASKSNSREVYILAKKLKV